MLKPSNKTKKIKFKSWLHTTADLSPSPHQDDRPRLADRWSFSTLSKLKLKQTESVGGAAPSAVPCAVSNLAHLQQPPLKDARSCDAADELKLAIDSIENAASGAKSDARKCRSEMSKAELEQQYRSWLELHEHKCDSQRMSFEASHRCLDHDRCGCSQRVYFILRYCEKFMDMEISSPSTTTRAAAPNKITSKFALFKKKKKKQQPSASQVRASTNAHLTMTDELMSKFMAVLSGYSQLQFTRDFRHLQIFHSQLKLNKTGASVDFTDTKALITYLYQALMPLKPRFAMSVVDETKKSDDEQAVKAEADEQEEEEAGEEEEEEEENVLMAVSKLMMRLQTKKEFNAKYMKLGLMATGANGQIFMLKSWKNNEFFALKEIVFDKLSIELKYELLRNWSMVQDNKALLGDDTELFMDGKRDTLLIVTHLYRGSMCDYLKDLYTQKQRCLSEAELRSVLCNGVLQSLNVLHSQSYIHGDIKPENVVYEFLKSQNTDNNNNNNRKVLHSAIIDYDLCAKMEAHSDGAYCEWRGTLGYAAPEWSPYRGVKSVVDTKVDVFSLALTMLILLCGDQPFLCPTAMRQKLQEKNPRMDIKKFVYETMLSNGEFMIAHFLQQLAPKISDDLHALLKFMLQFDPKRRATIHEVIEHRWLNLNQTPAPAQLQQRSFVL